MNRNQAVHVHAPNGRQHAFGIMTCAVCPACAREHSHDAHVCAECGSPLTLAVCAACDAINAIDAMRCHQCGARLLREPSLGDAAPFIGESELFIADSGRAIGDRKPASADTERSSAGTEGPGGDIEPTVGDIEPAIGDIEPAIGDIEPAIGNIEPAIGDTETAIGDLEPDVRGTARASDDDDLPRSSAQVAPVFVLDTIENTRAAHPDAEDDFIALGEKRYVGPDARQRALGNATPIAFAERVGHDAPLGESPSFASGVSRAVSSPGRRARMRHAHLGVALALVIVAGVSGYWAFDVPTLRGVVANSLARANAIAPLAARARTDTRIDRADNASKAGPSSASPPPAPAVPASAAPAIGTVPETSIVPESASNDARANQATDASSARSAPTARAPTARQRSPGPHQRPAARPHPQPSRPPSDRDAAETRRLIERDLGHFLAK